MTDEQLPGQDGTPGGQSPVEEEPRTGARALLSRRAVLFYAIVLIFLVAMLAGRADRGPLSPWLGSLDDAEVTQPADDEGSGDAPGGAVRPDDTDDGDATGDEGGGAPAPANGGNAATGPDGPAPASATPPPEDSQPEEPWDPVAYLDEHFGERLHPDTFPGLTQVNVFDIDENEWSATYKDAGSTDFDIVRITVQRSEDEPQAMLVLEEVRGLFTVDSVAYEWGKRDIVQSSDVRAEGSRESAFNFSWPQGRYVIDVTVYPPYRSGAVAGRDAALEFIGRLEY